MSDTVIGRHTTPTGTLIASDDDSGDLPVFTNPLNEQSGAHSLRLSLALALNGRRPAISNYATTASMPVTGLVNVALAANVERLGFYRDARHLRTWQRYRLAAAFRLDLRDRRQGCRSRTTATRRSTMATSAV